MASTTDDQVSQAEYERLIEEFSVLNDKYSDVVEDYNAQSVYVKELEAILEDTITEAAKNENEKIEGIILPRSDPPIGNSDFFTLGSFEDTLVNTSANTGTLFRKVW